MRLFGAAMSYLKHLAALLQARKIELGLGVRVTVAALGSLVIALALHLRLPLWAVLTAVVVTQLSVGRSITATRNYLVGTLGGAVYGGIIAVTIPHSGEGALLAVMVLAVAPLAFIAAINPSLNVATVTAIIVLLLPTMNRMTPLESAVDRVLEVAVGAITGLLVSFLVWPSRAHAQMRLRASRALDLLADALNELLAGLTRGRDVAALHQLQDGLGAALAGLNAIGGEAERERSARLSSGPDTGPLLRTILRLRHDIVIIGRATAVPLPTDVQMRLKAPLAAANDAIGYYLRGAGAALRTGRAAPAIWPVQTELRAYATEAAAVRSEGLIRGLPADVAERFFALGFSLAQMRQNLKDLDRCIAEWMEKSDVPVAEAEPR